MRAAWFLVCLACACGATSEATSDAGAPDAGGLDASVDVAPDYTKLFPDDRVIDVDLAIADSDWDLLMADPLVDVYVPATLTYDGVVVPNVAVRIKGNSSRRGVAMMGSERFSFKVDIDEYADQRLHGVDKINLNNGMKDPTFLREALANRVYRAFGVPAPRTAFARLSKNGSYFGLYIVVEQVDKDFLAAHFPDDGGNLYKPEQPSGDLTWRGDSIDAYPGLELKTNEDAPDHTALLRFLDVLNHGAPDEIDDVLDVSGLLRWLAVTTALVNLDSYAGTAHNYYLYEDRSSGRFAIISWDANEAYGNFACTYGPDELLALPHERPICGDPSRRPMIMRVLEVPEWRAEYETLLGELLAIWTPSSQRAEIDAWAALIRDDVAADPTKLSSITAFETGLHDDLVSPMRTTFGLSSFVERRHAALVDRLP